MNTIADCNIYPEIIGGEAWYGKICDTLAQWHIRTDTRYDMIKKWEYFIKDSMSYKNIDRSVIKSKDIILQDGQTYE